MKRWQTAQSCPPSEHLPPPEFANGLYSLSPTGKWIIHEKLPTPLDEFGRVDGQKLMEDVFSHIDPEYKWPKQTNVHHLQFPRRAYRDPATTDKNVRAIMSDFRENAPRQMRIPIQAHNLLHKVAETPRIPDFECMEKHVKEYSRSKALFQLGRRAINFGRWSVVAERELKDNDLSSQFGLLSRIYTERYDRMLDATPPPEMGIMPAIETLQNLKIHEVTAQLGKIAAVRAFDFRREAQLVVSQQGRAAM